MVHPLTKSCIAVTPQVERLGDMKQQVRTEASTALLALMAAVTLPEVLQRIRGAWGHRKLVSSCLKPSGCLAQFAQSPDHHVVW